VAGLVVVVVCYFLEEGYSRGTLVPVELIEDLLQQLLDELAGLHEY
jgi:hypothetical protein